MCASPMTSCQSVIHHLPPVTLEGISVLERLPIAVALHCRGNDCTCTAQPSLAQTSAWAVRLCRAAAILTTFVLATHGYVQATCWSSSETLQLWQTRTGSSIGYCQERCLV